MNTLTGLFDHMVLQRNSKKVSQAAFTGQCAAKGTLQARVLQGGKRVRGFKDVPIGRARDGKFKGLLQGLPTGGPYTIQLTIATRAGKPLEKLVVKDVLVGDVWVAAGQSNMQGCGIRAANAKSHPQVRAFHMDDHWGIARDPIHNLEIAVDPVHNGGNRRDTPVVNPRGAGPAIGFALEMQRITGVPQGIIASAHGGTSMAQWDPAQKAQGGKSLYGANLRRCIKNGGQVSGVIWYQGESDANDQAAPVYTQAMKTLVTSLRRDLKTPNLPFVLVQIGRMIGPDNAYTPWNSVQDQQRLLPGIIRNLSVVPSIDLALDDLIHIAGFDQPRLGRRLAYAMRVLIEGPRAGKPPIALKKVSLQPSWDKASEDVVLEFDNVAGKLTSGSRPTGFAIADPNDKNCVYKTSLEGSSVRLHFTLGPGAVDGTNLHYGMGTDPYCNITDAADRPLPVLGPIKLRSYRVPSLFVQKFQVTQPLPIAPAPGSPALGNPGKLHDLAYPADPAALPWREMDFPNPWGIPFANLHPELEKLGDADHLLYFACRLDCAEEMELQAGLGYDGPVKLWVDGQEKFHDPEGTNPATPDKARIKFHASAGQHDIVVALGTNNNRAWGILLHFDRRGLTKAHFKNGREKLALPRLISGVPGVQPTFIPK